MTEPALRSIVTAYAEGVPKLRSIVTAYQTGLPRLRSVIVAHESDPNTAPTGSPDPLFASVNENDAWSTSNSFTVTDAELNTVTVTYDGSGKPAWVTDDFDDTGATSYASGTTFTFGGTPPYTGAGSSSGSPYSWSYTISDGIGSYTQNVTLTVNNINRQPSLAPSPASPYAFIKDVAIAPISLVVDDPDGGNVTLSGLPGDPLPAGLQYEKPLGNPITLPEGPTAVPFTVFIAGTPTAAGSSTVNLRVSDGIIFNDSSLNFTVTAPSVSGRFVIGSSVSDIAKGFRRGRFRWKI